MLRSIDDRSIRRLEAVEAIASAVTGLVLAAAGALIVSNDPAWRSVYLFAASAVVYGAGRWSERIALHRLFQRVSDYPQMEAPPRSLLHPPPVPAPGEDEIIAPGGPVGKWLRVFAAPMAAGLCAFYMSAPQYPDLLFSTIINLSGIVLCHTIYLIPQRLVGIPMLCLWVSQNPDGIHVTMPWKTYIINPDHCTIVVASKAVRGRWSIVLCCPDRVWKLDLPRSRAGVIVRRWQQYCFEKGLRSAHDGNLTDFRQADT